MLLLDEPLSALDALTRAKLQVEIEAIWSQAKKTVVLITNDVDEAILLADRIVPLNPGPDASFGPEFRVPFERPRDRAAMNASAAYKKLRAAVTQYLMDAGMRRSAGAAEERRELPKIVPVQFDRGPPKRLPHRRRHAIRPALCRVLPGDARTIRRRTARSPWWTVSTC